MNIEERILLGRISRLADLTEQEQKQVERDEKLLDMLADNALLEEMAGTEGVQPDRQTLLDNVVRLSETKENQTMTIMNRILSGRRWQLQTAILAVAAVIIVVVSQVLPGPGLVGGTQAAWASNDGYTLVYELEGVSSFSTSESGLDLAIEKWRDRDSGYEGDLAIEAYIADGDARIAIIAGTATQEEIESLVVFIEEYTGMQSPGMTGTTVFTNPCVAGHGVSADTEVSLFTPQCSESLTTIAGIVAGEDAPMATGALVHAGGGPVVVGCVDTRLAPSPLASVKLAQSEVATAGAVTLFGSCAVEGIAAFAPTNSQVVTGVPGPGSIASSGPSTAPSAGVGGPPAVSGGSSAASPLAGGISGVSTAESATAASPFFTESGSGLACGIASSPHDSSGSGSNSQTEPSRWQHMKSA